MVKNTDEANDIVIINRHIKNLSIIFISFLISDRRSFRLDASKSTALLISSALLRFAADKVVWNFTTG